MTGGAGYNRARLQTNVVRHGGPATCRPANRHATTLAAHVIFHPLGAVRANDSVWRPSDRSCRWRRTTPFPRSDRTLDADDTRVGCDLASAYGFSTGTVAASQRGSISGRPTIESRLWDDGDHGKCLERRVRPLACRVHARPERRSQPDAAMARPICAGPSDVAAKRPSARSPLQRESRHPRGVGSARYRRAGMLPVRDVDSRPRREPRGPCESRRTRPAQMTSPPSPPCSERTDREPAGSLSPCVWGGRMPARLRLKSERLSEQAGAHGLVAGSVR